MRRLYVGGRDLQSHVEFSADDVTDVRDIPADQPPFVGEPATVVTLRPGARVDLTNSYDTDEFKMAFGPSDEPQARGIGFGLRASDACMSWTYRRCGSHWCRVRPAQPE